MSAAEMLLPGAWAEADHGRLARPRRVGIGVTLIAALICHLLAFLLVPSLDLADAEDTVRVLSVRVMNAIAADSPRPAPPQPLLPSPEAVAKPRPATDPTVPPANLSAAPPITSEPLPPPASTPVAQEQPTQAPAAAPVSVVAHVDTRYGDTPKPVYPPMSRRLGEEGTVMLRVRVSAGGTVTDIEIERSSGYPRLDEAARRAAADWRFVPARHGEQNIDSTVVVPLTFAMDS